MSKLSKSSASRTATFQYAGETVECRSLTMDEVRKVHAADGIASDALAISMSLDMTIEEASEWLAQAPAGDAVMVLAEVLKVSGLSEDARFRS